MDGVGPLWSTLSYSTALLHKSYLSRDYLPLVRAEAFVNSTHYSSSDRKFGSLELIPRPHPVFLLSLIVSYQTVESMYMLRTDCKLDQFVNGPLVYKLVNRFLNWLARFQLYKAKWSRL